MRSNIKMPLVGLICAPENERASDYQSNECRFVMMSRWSAYIINLVFDFDLCQVIIRMLQFSDSILLLFCPLVRLFVDDMLNIVSKEQRNNQKNGHQDMPAEGTKQGFKRNNKNNAQARILSLGVFLHFNRFQY